MKKELNKIMDTQNLDAIMVLGAAMNNPPMAYFTGLVHMTGGAVIKKKDGETTLFYNPMEREEAAKAGLKSIDMNQYNFIEMMKQFDYDLVRVSAERYKRMLKDAGVEKGKIAIYGMNELSNVFSTLNLLQEIAPEYEISGSAGKSPLIEGRVTKDDIEIKEMRKISRVNMEVVASVQDFLTSHKVKDNRLVKKDDAPLTIGDVKQHIQIALAGRGAADDHTTIFAIGRDAGVPHSTGTASDILELGKSIVFDIFPHQGGGGYHSDFTRTWSLGYATDEVLKLYEDVKSVFDTIVAELEEGKEYAYYQDRTCALFAAQGHPTIDKDQTISEGYVHSLGHGLGLNVHERPWCRRLGDVGEKLARGMVFTVEPGLYYPSKGMGCRIENSYLLGHDGKFENLTEYAYDLVIPVK